MQPAGVLIVEDDAPAALNLTHVLQHLCYDVVRTLTTAAEAVSRAGDSGTDLVLMSLDLPGAPSPAEAADQIRRWHAIPVIFLADTAVAAGCASTPGTYGCLVKPVEARRLNIAIEVALHTHRLTTKLRETETLLGQSEEIAGIGRFVVDRRHDTVTWSRSMYAIHGLDPDNSDDRRRAQFLDVIHPDDRPRVRSELEAMTAARSSWPIEFRIIRPDGEERIMRASADMEFDGQGELLRYVGISQDVTDWRRAMLALQQSEARFRTFFETNANYCYMVLPDGTIQDANAAALSVLGYTREALIGQPIGAIYAPESRARAAEVFGQWLDSGSVKNEELILLTRSGERRTVLLNVVPLNDGQGVVTHSVSNQTDITERKRAEAALSRYAQELEALDVTNQALLREINHRVKNNLSAILGLIYAERRRLGGETEPSCGEVLDDLSERIHDLADVHALISETGWRPLQLTSLVEEICRRAAPVAGGAQAPLIEVRSSPICVTPEQAHYLAMVIGELVMNSVKYACTGEGLRLGVEVTREGDQVRMIYRDGGPGYPDEVLGGGGRSVGLGLLNDLVTLSLRGTWSVRNDGGAVTELRFPVAA